MAVRKVEIRISVDDLDAGKRLDAIAAKLDRLSKGVFTIRLRLDDGGAALKLDKMAKNLDKIGHNTYTPRISPAGITAADAAIDRTTLKLDELGRKRVTAHVRIDTTGGSGVGGLLGGIFGGGSGGASKDAERAAADAGGGAAGGGAGGFLSFLGGANNSYMGVLIGGLVALAASIAPAVIPAGIGGLVGGGGALAAGRLGVTGLSTLRADRLALAQAQAALKGKGGNTASNRLALQTAQKAYARAQQKYAGFAPFGRGVNQLGRSALGSLLGALTGEAPGINTGGNRGGVVPGSSFLTGLTEMLAPLGEFVKSIGPLLGQMFRASLPFVQMFVKIIEQFAKAVMPAMLQSMKSFMPFMPQMVKAFSILAQGVASFIKDLGPGMKDGMTVFLGLMYAAKGILIALAYGADYTAKFFANFGHVSVDVARFVVAAFQRLKALVGIAFDAVKHVVTDVWDAIWHFIVTDGDSGVQKMNQLFSGWVHSIASTFDAIRHGIADAWDTIWINTKNAVTTGIKAVVNFFAGLPKSVGNVLKGFGTGLYNLGKTALNDMWSGLKSVGGSILGWFKNFVGGIPGDIMKLLHMSPPHPGSAFYDLGANFMHHLEAGVKSRAAHVASALHGAMGGPAGGSASAAAAYGRKLAASYGWSGQWGALNSVAMRESGWSMVARNPTSGAYGIAQFINGPSEYYQYGGNPNTIAGQVTGFFNYIKQRYGDPNAAWAHELNYGWYDKGGVLKKGLTLALNTTGQDEYITRSPGGGGGDVYNIYPPDSALDPDAYGKTLVQAIRRYKIHKGNAVLGIA